MYLKWYSYPTNGGLLSPPGDKINRVIVKNIVIIKAVGKLLNIKSAAHGKQVGRFLGMFKGEISRVVTTEAATGNSHFAHTGFVHGPGRQFFVQHTVVPDMVIGARGRVNVFIIPA